MIFRKTFENMVSCGVHIRTTGFRGGDSGHGGKTSVEMVFENGNFKTTSSTFEYPEKASFILRSGGDDELLRIQEGFQFVADSLKKAMKKTS